MSNMLLLMLLVSYFIFVSDPVSFYFIHFSVFTVYKHAVGFIIYYFIKSFLSIQILHPGVRISLKINSNEFSSI